VRCIGQISILRNFRGAPFALCHTADLPQLDQPDGSLLAVHHGPDCARELSTWGEDGSYRFLKGQPNLKRGWLILLENLADLRRALDGFYPAAVGLSAAWRQNRLRVQDLREKLERQTGIYRSARAVSDADAQSLVRQVCDPATQCTKRILWRIRQDLPLDDSPASRGSGIPDGTTESDALPLLCQEACNHFVSECCRLAKQRAAKAP
jgi:sirohydrochlorin cobaltochelatase